MYTVVYCKIHPKNGIKLNIEIIMRKILIICAYKNDCATLAAPTLKVVYRYPYLIIFSLYKRCKTLIYSTKYNESKIFNHPKSLYFSSFKCPRMVNTDVIQLYILKSTVILQV